MPSTLKQDTALVGRRTRGAAADAWHRGKSVAALEQPAELAPAGTSPAGRSRGGGARLARNAALVVGGVAIGVGVLLAQLQRAARPSANPARAGIPRERTLDSSLALLAEGYRFIANRCRRFGTDAFETRLMLQRATCVVGEDGARLLFGGDDFTRRAALPPSTLRLLQDKGSVHQLDGAAHRWRKEMFSSLMAPDRIGELLARTETEWRARFATWERGGEAALLDEARGVLTRAVCAWAGLPLTDGEAERRANEFGAMVEEAGSVGPGLLRGLLLRGRTNRWSRGVIDRVRDGRLVVPEGSPVAVVAWHRDHRGELLDPAAAAVELINLLRPTVAVDRFVTFAALALHDHPACRAELRAGDDDALERFVQEVRRFYPYFPAAAGRARRPIAWRGSTLEPGSWVMLDLYGTNHDARIWGDPEIFRPERFRRWDGNPYGFVPQGGGDAATGHRCPGERLTIELTKQAVRLLTTAIRYEVPEQDLRVDLSQMPAAPAGRFVIGRVSGAASPSPAGVPPPASLFAKA